MSTSHAVRASLEAVARLDADLHAFLTTFPDAATTHARLIDAADAHAGGLPLAGTTVAIKDNICLGPDLRARGDERGYAGRTTCASRMLEHYRSPLTATAAQRLIDAGAVIIGKTNLDEFAMGSSTEHSAFGPTRNPWDLSRVPGGSSGGSAAVVAARICPVALGSDTGGSIRQPASFCGVVGVKPTYGRVSRYGLVAFASSLDQIGVFSTDVEQAARVLDVICGPDPFDATTSDRPMSPITPRVREPVRGLCIGIPKQIDGSVLHPAMSEAFGRAQDVFRDLGAYLIEVDLPMLHAGIAAYYIVAPAEASSNLARYDGVRYGRRAKLADEEGLFDLYERSRGEGFGAEVKRRIMLGTHVLRSGYADKYYHTALRVRRLIAHDFSRAFAGTPAHRPCHVILTPTTTGPAFRIGEKTADPLALYQEDVFTVGVNLAGLPAMSLPAGFASLNDDSVTRELPLGVQLIAPAFDEDILLRAGAMFQSATDWHRRTPPMVAAPCTHQ